MTDRGVPDGRYVQFVEPHYIISSRTGEHVSILRSAEPIGYVDVPRASIPDLIDALRAYLDIPKETT